MDETKPVPKKRGPRKNRPVKRNPNIKNPWADLTPEEKAAKQAKMQAARRPGMQGRTAGLPDGLGKKAWIAHKETVQAETKIIMRKIVADNELNSVDDQYAIEALETAVNIMRLQGDARNKLGAAKLILEYTKAKPSTKSELTVNTAEDFLAQVLKDEAGE